MVSVNEAFHTWLPTLDAPVTARHYALGNRAVFAEHAVPTELAGRLDEALDADLVLYWGDWLQTTRFQASIVRDFPDGFDPDPLDDDAGPDKATRDVRRYLLMSGQPDDVLSRTGIVGCTTALNSSRDFLDDAYQHDLERLFHHAAFTLMRDPISVVHAEVLRGPAGGSCLGFDAAFLLDAERLLDPDRPPPVDGPYVAAYFGRNQANEKHAEFTHALARTAGARVVPIPWLGRTAHQGRLSSRTDRLRRRLARRGDASQARPYTPLRELLGTVAGARFVVTDTYHLAVNAWNLGVPAVMVADPTEDKSYSVNSGRRWAWRDKRFQLYSMIEALNLFVRTSELRRAADRRARVEHVAGLLASRERSEVDVVHERVARFRANLDGRLRRALGAG